MEGREGFLLGCRVGNNEAAIGKCEGCLLGLVVMDAGAGADVTLGCLLGCFVGIVVGL